MTKQRNLLYDTVRCHALRAPVPRPLQGEESLVTTSLENLTDFLFPMEFRRINFHPEISYIYLEPQTITVF